MFESVTYRNLNFNSLLTWYLMTQCDITWHHNFFITSIKFYQGHCDMLASYQHIIMLYQCTSVIMSQAYYEIKCILF